ncbi:MAG TPA: phage holin family protein [Gemmatimonadaceae bacterium]|nr:phage holin family protein [Gemmatimonadaceae bacterium]
MTARPLIVETPERPLLADPDVGIPDLIRRLTNDSRRLVTDEVQLAKIEARESLHRATRGVLWLALAFGAGVVMLVAVTLLLTSLLGRLMAGHMWFGALVTGVLELAVGAWLLRKGLSAFAEPSYSLEQTRASLAETASWTTTVVQR